MLSFTLAYFTSFLLLHLILDVGSIRFGEEPDTLDAEGSVLRRYDGPLPDEGGQFLHVSPSPPRGRIGEEGQRVVHQGDRARRCFQIAEIRYQPLGFLHPLFFGQTVLQIILEMRR